MRRMFTLICDECLDEGEPEWWAGLARQNGMREGWTRRNGRDLCPECSGRGTAPDDESPDPEGEQ